MKILMVTNTYTPIVGGVERSIKSFASEFTKLGHDVLIVTLEFDGMPEHEEGVIRVPAIRRFNGSDFSIRLPIPLNLSSVLNKFRPDIIHSHHPVILGDTALRISNQHQVPIVFTHHTKYEDYTHYVPLNSPAMKKFVIELTTGYANLVDQVIAPSQSIKELLLERGVTKPIKMVPTGVDFDKYSQGSGDTFRKEYGINNTDFVVGHVGRLAVEKNLSFLIQSVLSFLKQQPRAKFLLVGTGPSLDEIEKLFKQKWLEDRLILTGVLEGQKLIDAYHAMDVFAFSSKTETQGIVLLESMAAGVPVVALNATGVSDFVKDKFVGRIVFKENIDEFAGALNWIFHQDDTLRKKLKHNAKEFAASVSIHKTAEQMIRIYQSLLEKRFVYSDIQNSHWAKTLGSIKMEWDLLSNYAEAMSSVIKDKLKDVPRESLRNKIEGFFKGK